MIDKFGYPHSVIDLIVDAVRNAHNVKHMEAIQPHPSQPEAGVRRKSK